MIYRGFSDSCEIENKLKEVAARLKGRSEGSFITSCFRDIMIRVEVGKDGVLVYEVCKAGNPFMSGVV